MTVKKQKYNNTCEFEMYELMTGIVNIVLMKVCRRLNFHEFTDKNKKS